MLFDSILKKIGNTPIFRFPYSSGIEDVEFYIKLEGENLTGSVKDRAAYSIIMDKINTGELAEGKTILDASSGSFACSLAFLGKMLGYPVTVVTGSKLTEDKAVYIRFYGAKNIPYGNFTIEGNRYCQDVLLKENPNKYCFLDQLHNPNNANMHERVTGPEIMQDLPGLSAVAFSLGSGGTLCGISRFLKKHYPQVKIIAVTAQHGTKIPGTGAFVDGDYITPFIKEANENNYYDYVAEISEEDARKRTIDLSHKYGFYVGIQTGGVLQGLIDGINKLKIAGKVLVISGDAGWENMEKLSSLI